MIPEYPTSEQIPQLRVLWKLAFGDDDAFLDSFFSAGFSPERCRCITRQEQVVSALYWFDVQYQELPYAYLYAVATHPDFRRQGLIRYLIADTHQLLAEQGYAGALLVPGNDDLRRMYTAMGYEDCTQINEFFCSSQTMSIPLQPISREEYQSQRRNLLPKDAVIQEGDNLRFLETQANFYAGSDFLLCAAPKNGDLLRGIEFLGNPELAPRILCTLGCSHGTFRTPGQKLPFAMFCPLQKDAPAPGYFGLAFD